MAEAMDRLIELEDEAAGRQQERTSHFALMEAVIEALPDGLVVTDAEGKVVMFNERAELLFGHHRSDILGHPLEKLMPQRFRADHAHYRALYNRFEITQRARRIGGIGTGLVGMRNDGHEFPTDITLARMVVKKGIYNLALIRLSPPLLDEAFVPGHCRARKDSDQDAAFNEPDVGC